MWLQEAGVDLAAAAAAAAGCCRCCSSNTSSATGALPQRLQLQCNTDTAVMKWGNSRARSLHQLLSVCLLLTAGSLTWHLRIAEACSSHQGAHDHPAAEVISEQAESATRHLLELAEEPAILRSMKKCQKIFFFSMASAGCFRRTAGSSKLSITSLRSGNSLDDAVGQGQFQSKSGLKFCRPCQQGAGSSSVLG